MLTFLITTSSKMASLSLYKDDNLLGNININVRKTHSTYIVEQVENLFKWCEVSINDVDNVVLSEGPGSFTGVRIAMSLVKGLFAINDDKNFYLVSDLDAIAYLAKDYCEYVLCGIDSRKGKIYYSLYHNGVKIIDDSVGNIYELCEQLKDKKVIYAGDIAKAYNLNYNYDDFRLVVDSRVYFEMFKKNLLKKVDLYEMKPYYLELSQAEKDG